MSSHKVPVRSILKQQPKQPAKPTDEQKAQAEQHRKNMDLALFHAHKIQGQKDVQAQILDSIETLLEIPAGPKFTSEEADTFTLRAQQFQPSDLDDLAEERRIDGRCGYALCGNVPRVKMLGPAAAAWKLSKGAADYCSEMCVTKAFYVKTQLGEVPAWERDAGQQTAIVLHPDDRLLARSPESSVVGGPRPSRARQYQVANHEELALERGENLVSAKPKRVMADQIVEKGTVLFRPLSSVNDATVSHTAIEGYEPTRDWKSHARPADDEENSSSGEDND